MPVLISKFGSLCNGIANTEAFVVCRNYRPPIGYEPTMIDPLLDRHYGMNNPTLGSNRVLVPFVACGDLNGFDSDQNYPLEVRAARIASHRTEMQCTAMSWLRSDWLTNYTNFGLYAISICVILPTPKHNMQL
jgi:hypothetical protein